LQIAAEERLMTTAAPVLAPGARTFSRKMLVGSLLAPALAIAFWFAPLGMEARAQHALAIVLFMAVLWVTEPIDYGVTAMIGCYLFWALKVTRFETAFSGFADNTPWFLFGAMLMGEAASATGLARRIGFYVMRLVGTSYAGLLFSLILFVLVLNFLVPSGLAQITIVGPIAVGILAAFEVDPKSNIARGMFVMLTYCCGLFNKMMLAGGAAILTRGMVEKITGKTIFWSQYFIAFLPAILLTLAGCWLCVLWLYPPEKKNLPGGRAYLDGMAKEWGPWTSAQKKTLGWLILAILLWATDSIHHLNPAIVAIGGGLLVSLPGLGVLSTKDVRRVNFLLIIFVGGSLGMGEVLVQTKALDVLTRVMINGIEPFMGGSLVSSSVLYWGAFLYHFALASEISMLSTLLPVMLKFSAVHHMDPAGVAMICNFASAGKIFIYQSAVLMLGYSFGHFETKDLLKVGAVLSVFEGLLLMALVPIYWPLIGMPLFVGSPTGYHLAGKYPVGGEAGWDYINLDPDSRQLFISHVTGIEVLDADSGRRIGHIADTPGVHGIALASEFGRGFVGNGKTDTVSVIDLKTLAHTGELKAGKKPDAIVYDPGTHKVIVADAESHSVTIIDAATPKVLATIDIGGAPEYIATDLKGTAWVDVADKDSIATIDMKALKVTAMTPLPGCKEPTALSIDRGKGRLYIGCRNKVMAIADAASMKVIATLPIGEHVDAAAFDPDSGLAFASTGDGYLTIIKESAAGQFSVVENVKTQRTAKTMVLDPKTKKIFLPAVEGAPEDATGPPKASGPGAYKAGPFVVLVMAR
jgi:anion transporter